MRKEIENFENYLKKEGKKMKKYGKQGIHIIDGYYDIEDVKNNPELLNKVAVIIDRLRAQAIKDQTRIHELELEAKNYFNKAFELEGQLIELKNS